jgi:very-short-patch-repair endonuclease
MPAPLVVQRGEGRKARKILTQCSFGWFLLRQRWQLPQFKDHGIGYDIVRNSRDHYGKDPRFARLLKLVVRMNYAEKKFGNKNGEFRKKLDGPRKEYLEAAIENGWSLSKIARTSGVSEYIVAKSLKRNGLTNQSFREAQWWTTLTPQEIAVLEASGIDMRRMKSKDHQSLTLAGDMLTVLLVKLRRAGASIGGSNGEAYFRSELVRRRIRHVHGFLVSDNRRGEGTRRVDFYIPQIQTVVEIDGPYHRTPKGRARDKGVDQMCRDRGYKVIRVPYNQLSTAFCAKAKELINDLQDQINNSRR